jgi:hypothetical protein
VRNEIDDSFINRSVDLRSRVTGWSDFMSGLHGTCTTTRLGSLWMLDSQSSPVALGRDSDIETKFVKERNVLSQHWLANIITVWYLERQTFSDLDLGFNEMVSISDTSVPTMRRVTFRQILSEILRSAREGRRGGMPPGLNEQK